MATPVRVRAGVVAAMVAAAVAVPRAVAAVCAAAAAAAAVASVAVRSVTHRDCFSPCSLFLSFQKSSCEKWGNVKKKESQFTFWGFAPNPTRELSSLGFPLRFAAI